MLSESERMASAHELTFRIKDPNSKPRSIAVIALDKASAGIVDQISHEKWNGAHFFTSLSFSTDKQPAEGQSQAMQAWLNDLAGRALNLVAEVEKSDFVVVITAAGEDARAVSVIADACAMFHKSLLGLVIPQDDTSEKDIDISLGHLRPHSRMLVVAHGIDYIEVMLTALRA
jgi:hypothetical protein